MQVNVGTEDGRVTLRGAAPEAGARETATELVKAIKNVVDVVRPASRGNFTLKAGDAHAQASGPPARSQSELKLGDGNAPVHV